MASVVCTLENVAPASPPRVEGRSGAHEFRLIRQILAGRKDLFDDLLKPHLTSLLLMVRARMGSESEIDDIVQQAAFKAFARLDQFRFEASFRTWLIRIALNEVLQWRRKGLSSRFVAMDHAALANLPVEDRTDSPLKQCELHEAMARFRDALGELPQQYQVMIQLRDMEDLSISEVAQLLRVSVSAAKARHRRARRQILRLLAPHNATPGSR